MKENTKTLLVSDNEIQYIVNVLAERPYKESAPLIAKIVRQSNAPVEEESDAE